MGLYIFVFILSKDKEEVFVLVDPVFVLCKDSFYKERNGKL